MKLATKILLLCIAVMAISGCHSIYHVKDIRPAGDGKIEVEKCEYYINGFWGTGGYKDCKVETIAVK